MKIVHHGFKVNVSHRKELPHWYFYPKCNFITGRNSKKIFGDPIRHYKKYSRNYSKDDLVLVTENWKKVTCKECLRRHPNSPENKEARREKEFYEKKLKAIDKIIAEQDKTRQHYINKIHKIENMWIKKIK